jgi:sugar phosphate isomerase/epimerase
MSWPIGVSTGTFYPFQTMEHALHSINELGYEVAELFLQTPSEYTPIYARRILRTVLSRGIRVHSVHLHTRDFDIFSPYPPRRADSDALFRQALELASGIGAKVVNWHGARLEEIEKGLSYETIWESVARWHGWALDAGLTLTLENVSWCMLRTPEHIAEALAAIPDLHFTFDSFQAAEVGIPPDEMVQAMRGHIATVHLSDFDPRGARHLPPGRGIIDWQALLLTLADVGYDGPLLLELSHQTAESYESALAEGRDFLTNLIDTLNLRLRLT